MTVDQFQTELMNARKLSSGEFEGIFRRVRETVRGMDDGRRFAVLFPLAVKSQTDAPSYPAAQLLRELSPACPLSCEDAVRALLPDWDVSIEEVPFYLAARFGVVRLKQAIRNVEMGVGGMAKTRLETVAYWLDNYEAAYGSGS